MKTELEINVCGLCEEYWFYEAGFIPSFTPCCDQYLCVDYECCDSSLIEKTYRGDEVTAFMFCQFISLIVWINQRLHFFDEDIALWHSGWFPDGVPLAECLGLSDDEYVAWVEDPWTQVFK